MFRFSCLNVDVFKACRNFRHWGFGIGLEALKIQGFGLGAGT